MRVEATLLSANGGFGGVLVALVVHPGHHHLVAPLGALDLERQLEACRTLVVDSENRPRRDQFLPDSPPHGGSMGQEAGEKWAVAVVSQPTIPKGRVEKWRGNGRSGFAVSVPFV